MCVCRPSDERETWRAVCQYYLVDVKGPTVSFTKSKRVIAGAMNKLLEQFEQIEQIEQTNSFILSSILPWSGDSPRIVTLIPKKLLWQKQLSVQRMVQE